MEKYQTIKKPGSLSSFFFLDPGLLLLVTLTGILYNFGMLINPFFQGKLVDSVELFSQGKYSFSSMLWLILLYIILILAVQGVRALKRFFVRKFSYDITENMRNLVYHSTLSLSEEELGKEKIGVLLSRNLSDITKTVEGMRKLLTEIFDTVVLFLFYILFLFFFDPLLSLYVLLPVFFSVIVAFLLRKLVYRYEKESRSAYALLSSLTYDGFDHGLLYRIYSAEKRELNDYDRLLTQYEKASRKSLILKDTSFPIVFSLSLFGLIPLFLLGLAYVKEGRALAVSFPSLSLTSWTVGTFTTYLSTFVLLSHKASHTAKLFSSIESGLASWKRIKPSIRPYRAYPEGKETQEQVTLSFSHYGLKAGERTLVRDFSFQADSGEIIGITGMVSSGKTLLLRSLLGEKEYQGSVMLFGKEVRDYRREDLARNISYMGHESALFTDTIENNIALGEKKDVWPYLRLSSFAEEVLAMPEKEKTLVGNAGVRLSGGQKERLMLSRTFYHQRKLVLLDDPFASLDQKTEKSIMEHLLSQKDDSLILLVSHRLSFFPLLKTILVFTPEGKIEVGDHQHLLKTSKTYQKLWEKETRKENKR